MCGIRSVGSAQRRPARPSELLSATATVLARDSLCVHHVRELLAAHGIAPTGPRGRPDLLVLVADDAADLLALAPASRDGHTAPRELVLTHGAADDELALSAVRAGADGIASLGLTPAAMHASLAALLRGEAVLPRITVAALLSELRLRPGRLVRRDDGRSVQLPQREWQVLDLLSSGCSTAEVAGCMVVTEATVRGYLRTAVARLRAADRAEAVRIFQGSRFDGATSAGHGDLDRADPVVA